MKWLSVTLLLLLPLLSFAQAEHTHKNGIGLHLTYNGIDGLGASFRYKRQIGNRGAAKFEFNTNCNDTYVGRIGYEFLQLRFGRFEVGTGVDLKYKFINQSEYLVENYKELAIELPIELRFQLTPEISIYSGISFSKLLSSNKINGRSFHNSPSEIRLGMGYKF